MRKRPTTEWVRCTACDAEAVDVIPPKSRALRAEDRSDGKVWVDCRNCDERFLVYFRRIEPDQKLPLPDQTTTGACYFEAGGRGPTQSVDASVSGPSSLV